MYNLKQLESKLPKAKGIISQAVKEILASLTDEGAVDNDKIGRFFPFPCTYIWSRFQMLTRCWRIVYGADLCIGAGQFFWAFPSKALRLKQNKIEELKEAIASSKAIQVEKEKEKESLLVGREPSGERDTKLRKLNTLKEEGLS